MERVLRDHFETESSDLRMSKDPWDWLESRMEEPEKPSLLSRITNRFSNFGGWRPGPVFSAAGAAAVVLVAIFVTLNVLIDGDPGNQLDVMLASEPKFEDSDSGGRTMSSAATAAPAPTAAPVAAAPTMAPTAAPTMAPTRRPTPPRFAATAAPALDPIPRATMEPTPTRQRFVPEAPATATPASTAAPAFRPTAAPTAAPTAVSQANRRHTSGHNLPRLRQGALRLGSRGQRLYLQPRHGPHLLLLSPQLGQKRLRRRPRLRPRRGVDQRLQLRLRPATSQRQLQCHHRHSSAHPIDSSLHLARIAFQAPELDYDSTPVNVTLVIDASGLHG